MISKESKLFIEFLNGIVNSLSQTHCLVAPFSIKMVGTTTSKDRIRPFKHGNGQFEPYNQ